jgi:hypothetical protein
MAKSRISYNVKGLNEMIESLKSFEKGGKNLIRLQEEFDAVLGQTFQTSQELAHRRTGTLIESGDATSEHGATEWVGTISYAAPGVPFEMQRGGEHSAFIDQLSARSAQDFEDAIDKVMKNL